VIAASLRKHVSENHPAACHSATAPKAIAVSFHDPPKSLRVASDCETLGALGDTDVA